MKKPKQTNAKVLKPAAPNLAEDCGCGPVAALVAVTGIGIVEISCAPNAVDPTQIDVTVTVDSVTPPPGGLLDPGYPVAQLRQPPNTAVDEKQMDPDGNGYKAEFQSLPPGDYFAKVLVDYIITTVQTEVKTSGTVSCAGA